MCVYAARATVAIQLPPPPYEWAVRFAKNPAALVTFENFYGIIILGDYLLDKLEFDEVNAIMHEHHKMLESDDNFENGTLYHLVADNEGRALDGRRTPGFIENYDFNLSE